MNTATATIAVNGNGNLDNGAGPGPESLHARQAPIRTNAAQLQKMADVAESAAVKRYLDRAAAVAESDEATGDGDPTGSHAFLIARLDSIRATTLNSEVNPDDAIALAMADAGKDWQHPSWGIPANLDRDTAKAMWLCKVAAIPLPAKRRVTQMDVAMGKASETDFAQAMAYRSVMNKYQNARAYGRALLGHETTAAAKKKGTGRGKGKGKGKGGAELISRAKADEYVKALVAFCDANVSDTNAVLSPLMRVLERAAIVEAQAPTVAMVVNG